MASYYQRVKRTSGYTIMSNYHLRDMNLSLKASGLLSLVLSLPEDWQYSVKGLTAIVKEGESAVKSALQELEQHGYLRRTEIRTESGKFQGLEYIFLEYPGQLEDLQNPNGREQTIQNMQKKMAQKMQIGTQNGWDNTYEALGKAAIIDINQPGVTYPITEKWQLKTPQVENPLTENQQSKTPRVENPLTENQQSKTPRVENPLAENQHDENTAGGKSTCGKSTVEKPEVENPTADKPIADNRRQIIKDINKDIDISINQSNHNIPKTEKRLIDQMDVMETYRDMIRNNIGYATFSAAEKGKVDDLVNLMVETLMLPDSENKTIRIAGEKKPVSIVKSVFLQLDMGHIQYVLESLSNTTSRITNMKSYLLTALYNAPLTINNYYQARVNHDFSADQA